VQNPARLSLQNRQLLLKTEAGEGIVPLEDIAVVMLESPQVTLTTALCSALSGTGAVVVTCDETHTPNGIALPFANHSRHADVAFVQQAIREPFKKRLWQAWIRGKIRNQAACMEAHVPEAAATLTAMAALVQSGDAKNQEATAARFYWPILMGKDFKRSDTDIVNAALNYGYAILRSGVARALVAAGLLPVFGIHHQSTLNAFNLADDMVEVFRPMVDSIVLSLKTEGVLTGDSLNKDARARLIAVMHHKMRVQGEVVTVLTALDLMASGLVAAMRAGNIKLCPIPEFILGG
jgi:CRISP-associated protein Cas1